MTKPTLYEVSVAAMLADVPSAAQSRLATVAQRYMEIVRDEASRLSFSPEEWLALVSAGQGIALIDWDGDSNGRMFWAAIEDSEGERLGVDHSRLAGDVRRLPPAARNALIEVIRLIWQHDTVPPVEMLERLGVTPKNTMEQ